MVWARAIHLRCRIHSLRKTARNVRIQILKRLALTSTFFLICLVGFCSGTEDGGSDETVWFMVDLGEIRSIDSVKLVVPGGAMAAEWEGFEILLSSVSSSYDDLLIFGEACHPGSDLGSAPTNAPYSEQVDCVGVGRYVFVLVSAPERPSPGTGFSRMELCEVEVYGSYIPPSSNEVENAVLAAAVMKAADSLGLNWQKIGTSRPTTGTEINDAQFVAALRAKVLQNSTSVEFTQQEKDGFEELALSSHSYVCINQSVGNCSYFQPAAIEMTRAQFMAIGVSVSLLTVESYIKVGFPSYKYYRPLNETALEGGRGCWDWVECDGFYGTSDPAYHHSASHNCDHNATCSETIGSFECACNPGWRGDGLVGNCRNIDECAENTHDCSPYGACTDVIGSFLCTCNTGFYGNGTLCKDQDQCAAGVWGGPQNDCAIGPPAGPWGPGGDHVPAGNQSIAFCNDTFGSFTCTCNTGYEGNGTQCEDLNECVLADLVCTNSTYNVSANVTTNGSWTMMLEEMFSRTCRDVPVHDCDINATCTNGPGSFTCSCNAGYIGNGTDCEDLNECDDNTTCPTNAFCYNTVGSFYCECDRGYTGSDVYNCTACPAGKYKNVTGSSNCTDCPQDTYSSVPAVQTLSGCLRCPLNSDSKAATTNSTDCLCRPGYTWQDLQACAECVAGKYKPDVGPHGCTECPAGTYLANTPGVALSGCLGCANNSDAPAGSGTESSCLCNIGFTGPDGGPCSTCDPGSYKNTTGSATCTLCEANQYSEIYGATSKLDCLSCTAFSLSVAGADMKERCLCIPGYAGAGLPGQLCVPCGPGTHKNVSGHDQCTSCPEHSTSPAGSSTLLNCTCLPGYFGANGEDCTICGEGKYKPESGDGECQDCPPRTSSPAGSEVSAECACAPGAFGPNGQACQLCEAGKYKPELGSDDCMECIPNSISPAGSNRSGACICNRGYEGSGDTQCANVNECLKASDNDCAVGQASCTDTDGSFTCSCIEPYFGNGTSCEPAFVRLAMELQLQVGVQRFELYREAFVRALADLCGVPIEAVELLLVQAGLLQRRLLSVNGTETAMNVTNIDLVLNVGGLNLNNILTLLSPANLNSTMVRLGLPPIFVLTPARLISECGNGVIEASEACDDGNTVSGDGCSVGCSVEIGWECLTPSPSITCESFFGQTCNGTWCNSTCLQGTNSSTTNNGTNISMTTASMCKDIDECELNAVARSACNASQETGHRNCTPALCDAFATCYNSPGSFYCQCFEGFIKENGLCVDDPGNNATLQRDATFANESTATLRNLSLNAFGHAVSIHRNYLLLGSLDSFDAHLYEKKSPGEWPKHPTYVLSRPDSGDGAYGLAVAVYSAGRGGLGTGSVHAVIGTNRNKVYIHEINAYRAWTGSMPHILERDDLFFGTAVAASSTSVLVGAYGAHKAFLYTRQSDRSWPNEPSNTFDQNTESAFFGHVVAMTEDIIAIGALYVDKVFIFARAVSGAWPSTATQVLTPAAGDASLGASLSLTPKNLFVGTPGKKRVYIFTRNSTGFWLMQQHLSLAEGRFGHCVSNTDLYAVVGAFRANKAYIYRAHRNGTWASAPVQKLSQGTVHARSFGFACGITNHDVVLSSYQVNVVPCKLLLEMPCVCLVPAARCSLTILCAGSKRIHIQFRMLSEFLWLDY